MTLRSRSASTSWDACSGVALAFMLASGCGPSLGMLLRERHYNDAICAASFDGTGLSTRRVAKSLAQDLSAAIHLHPITTDELRSAFAGKLHQDVELLQQQFLFVRLLYSANSVPVGPFGLAVRVQTDRGLLRVIDFSRYESVLALTRERVPSPRTGIYDSTSAAWVANFFASPFLLMANFFFIRRSPGSSPTSAASGFLSTCRWKTATGGRRRRIPTRCGRCFSPLSVWTR